MKCSSFLKCIRIPLVVSSLLIMLHSCDLIWPDDPPDDPPKPPVVVDSLGVSVSSVAFDCNKDACLLIVRTTENWTATASAAWVNLSTHSGKGNTAFLIGVNENPEMKRSATVAIQVGQNVKQIEISQDGALRMVLSVSGVNLAFRRIQGGAFAMSQGQAYLNFDLSHQVTLSDFYILETEVTNLLWQTVMKALPYDTIPGYPTRDKDSGPQQPVSATNWHDIVSKFLPALNQLTNKQFHLPTEAQWEYAASGGKYAQGKKFAGSNDPDEVAWYVQNSSRVKHDVGLKDPNEMGLFDMSGNVSEWCSDWHHDTFGFPVANNVLTKPANLNDPTGPASGTRKVVRGGHYQSEVFLSVSECNVRQRYSIFPNGYYIPAKPEENTYFMSLYTGFRIVIME